MGSAVARTLLAAGHPATVWNRSPDRCQPLGRAGASIAPTVADAIKAAEIVVVTLTNPEATKQVLATNGVDEAIRGRTLIEFSVGNPANRIALESWCAGRGARYLAGGIKAAPLEMGTSHAIVKVWGNRQAFEDVQSTLDKLGTIRYLSDNIRAEETLASVGPPMTAALVSVFIEAAAYLRANKVPIRPLLDNLETTYKIARGVAVHCVDLIEEKEGAKDQFEASLQTWFNSVSPLVRIMRDAGVDARTAEAGLATFRAAIDAGVGSREADAMVDVVLGKIALGTNGTA
jgi:3-hydroxyisobutyrate dehydrogenase-like beta-hydroxyacid dehydrogenase